MNKPKVFITGGAGFIGANVAAHYLSHQCPVTIYDNLSRPGVKANIDWLKQTYNPKLLQVVVADVQNYTKLKLAQKHHQVIFHLAGQTAVTTSIHNPRADFDANAIGTFNLLEAVRLNNPEAIVVYSSTNKVYGSLADLNTKVHGTRYRALTTPSIDESQPLDFHSPYGCSKGIGDQYMLDYARVYGVQTIVFRQSCIYGSRQFGVEDQGWVAHFTKQVINNLPITIFGNGKQVRDLLFIDDLVSAYQLAVNKINITRGQTYNIGGGITNSLSLLELVRKLELISNTKVKLNYQPKRQGDQNLVIMNTDKAYLDFGWRPTTDIDTGLGQLYRWLQSITH